MHLYQSRSDTCPAVDHGALFHASQSEEDFEGGPSHAASMVVVSVGPCRYSGVIRRRWSATFEFHGVESTLDTSTHCKSNHSRRISCG